MLMENRPELPDGTANPPVASAGIAGLFHRAGVQSETRLSSNPDVSNRNVKKTKLSLFRGLAVCYLKPPRLRDLTTLRGHIAGAERILSSGLTVK